MDKKLSIIVLGLLLLSIINPVSAISETVDIIDESYGFNQGTYPRNAGSSYMTGTRPINEIIVPKAEYLHNIRALYFRIAEGNVNNFPKEPQSFAVDFTINDKIVGYGRYGTFNQNTPQGVDNVFWISFETLDISSYSGFQQIIMKKKTADGIFPTLYRIISNPNTWGTWTSNNHRVYLGMDFGDAQHTENVPCHSLEVYYENIFRNQYTISETNNGWHDFTLTRTIEGVKYPSELHFQAGDTEITSSGKIDYKDVFLQNIMGTPITVSIKSPGGTWYNKTFGSSGIPDDKYKFTVSSAEPESYYPVIKTGEDFTVSFDADSADLESITHIFYTIGDNEFFKSNQEFGEGYTRFFKKVDGSWFKYNDDTYEFDISSSEIEATFQTFPGPSGRDNTWKLLGVAKAGNANIVCDQTTHIQVEGDPIPEDQSKTGIRVYLLDAKTDDAIGKNAHIIVKNPFGEIVAEADTYKGFHDFIVDRPDPFNPNYKYEVSATIDGYAQNQPVFVIPLAIYPAYEIANIYFDLPIIPDKPEDGFIQFYVHSPNGLPIKDARIWMKNAEGREWLRITNKQGSTGFPLPKNATYTYRTESDIYRTLTGSITLTSDYDVVRLTLIGLESPTTPYVPTPTKKPGDDDDIPSGNFLEQSCKAMATIFGVSLDIGKAIFGLIMSLGIGTGVAKQLRGGAPEFALGFLGGLFLAVLVGLLPYWTIVVALLFAGVYAGRSIMDSGGGGAAKK